MSTSARSNARLGVGAGLLIATASAIGLATGCGDAKPPLLPDWDGSHSEDDARVYPNPLDAGAPPNEAGVASARDYGAVCDPGKLPVWHFFDFMTHTPGDSSILFRAQTAASEGALDTATSVELANVTGPDNSVWTGVDVEPKLETIGEKSLLWLRVTRILVAATADAGEPVLLATRVAYDCISAQ